MLNDTYRSTWSTVFDSYGDDLYGNGVSGSCDAEHVFDITTHGPGIFPSLFFYGGTTEMLENLTLT